MENNLNVSLDVVGENGEDMYFSEKAVVDKLDIYQVVETIKNWLDLYETMIPYDGRVVGVLGDQITFEFAKNKRVAVGQEFKIKRMVGKKKHPLLKKVVEWDSNIIARGKVFNLSKTQALGAVKVYMGEKKVNPGDWIRLEKFDPRKVLDDEKFSHYEQQSFGRLGDVSLALAIDSHDVNTTAVTGSNKMNGYLFGIAAELELWVTRNYFVGGEYGKRVGDVSKTSGSPNADTSAQSISILKFIGGYKYLPMGFFYGPQVNIYTGWAKYSYQMDSSGVDGFGTNNFNGFLLGLSGNVPVKRGLRIFGSGEIIPFADFEDEDNFYGSADSLSSLALEFGVLYQWVPNLKLSGSLEMLNNAGKFSGANDQLRYSDTTFKLGGVLSF